MKSQKNGKKLLWVYLALILIVILIAGGIIWRTVDRYQNKTLIASGHPEWAPIMWRDGDQIIGAGPDLVKKICTDLNIKCDIIFEGQWQEVQDKTKSGEIDMLVAAYKTDERQTYMDYSEAYTIDPIALFIKSGSVFAYQEWSDLIGKKGVATTGDSYGQKFDDYIKDKLTVERVATAEEAFNKILSGSADYLIYGFYGGEKEIEKQNLTGKVESFSDNIASENFYIAVSKKSPYAKYLPQINELITNYKTDGTISRLIEQNKILSGLK